ncbi:hypothetical protein AMTR_s00080p00053460 [Amborella trichopoda]|uniref:RRM domain-containing protein n=2 Tax=Amborella trichopoda TaxID=13333 RepID=W1PBA7_AMBTC|nr:hypothetical protein AMTR_s00080p00053460 [Amborella trichopoda]
MTGCELNDKKCGQFGDTTLTKVFVGGLAWETQREAMKLHFEQFGEILEAVIISDKSTGRSKGYGFVTFKDPESARKACEDATPMINGRRANCNLASLGARRPRTSTPQPGQAARPAPAVPTAGSIQWYYHPTPIPYHQQPLPFHAYGYYPTYYTDMTYNPKMNYCGGYMSGQIYSGGQGVVHPTTTATNAATMMPVYPLFHFPPQSQTLGLPAPAPHHLFHAPAPAATQVATLPAYISKAAATPLAPTAGSGLQLKVSVQEFHGVPIIKLCSKNV